jgi:uncharacterized protein DUF3152
MNPVRVLRILAIAGVAASVVGAGVTAIRGPTPARPAAVESSTPIPSATPIPPTPTVETSPAPVTQPKPSTRRDGLMPTLEPIEASSCGDAKAAKVVRWRVEVDRDAGVEPEEFASRIASIICDRRSWIASGRVRFRYHPQGSLLIGLRTPGEAERRCYRIIGLSVQRRWSCGTPREIVINSARWKGGSEPWPGTLHEYRRMLTNHEVGHALGLHHEQCASDGAPAPVMMQQSKGMTSENGRTCKPNPWPLPPEIVELRS